MVYATYKQSSTETESFTLTDATGGSTDLTSDTVYITLYFTGSDVQDPGVVTGVNDVEVDTYVDRSTGRVSHTFASDDLSEPGRYQVYFRVNDGSTDSIYPKGDDFYTIDVESVPTETSAGTIDSTTTLSQTLDVDGNVLSDIGTLQFRDTGSTPDSAGELQRNGASLLYKPDPTTPAFAIGSGGSSSGSVDVYNDSGQVTADAELLRFLDDNSAVSVTVDNPAAGEADVTYQLDDGSVGAVKLSFDPATQSELDTHAANPDVHHGRYEDAEAQEAVGTILTSIFRFDDTIPEIDLKDGSINSALIEDATVQPSDIDGSGGSAGQVLGTDGSATGVSWVAGGGGSSVWTDTSTDNTDGGDIYRLPGAEDSWDGQGSQEARNLEHVEAGTGEFGQLKDRSSGNTVDIDALVSAVPDAEVVTISGDGTKTFSLPHSLGTANVHAQAASKPASTDFWITNRTTSAIDIEYAAEPPQGTDNLVFVVYPAGGSGGSGGSSYSDADAINAINTDTDHGSTASHAPSDLDADGASQGDRLEWDGSNWVPVDDVLANGTATLSSGSTTVDTGVTVSTSGFYEVGLRPESSADIAASLEDDSGGTGNWVIHLEENTTSVGNPDVGWQLKEQ